MKKSNIFYYLLGVSLIAGIPTYYSIIYNQNKNTDLSSSKVINKDYYIKLGHENVNRKNYLVAIKNFTMAIKKDPKDSYLYYLRANINFKLLNYSSALTDLSKAIELDPNNAKYWRSRGITNIMQGNYTLANSDLSIAIELNPNNPFNYHERGKTKNSLKDYLGAINDFKQAIKIDPSNPVLWNDMGVSKLFLGKYRNAIKDFSKAIELDPKISLYWMNRGTARNSLKKYSDAIDDYSKAIKLDPDNPSIYNLRGLSRMKTKNYSTSNSDFTQAINLLPKNKSSKDYASFYYNRGILKGTLKDFSGSRDDFSNSIKYNSNIANSYINRGHTKFKLQNLSGSCIDYKKAKSIDNSYTIPGFCEKINIDQSIASNLRQEAVKQKINRDTRIENYKNKCYSMYKEAKYASGYIDSSRNYYINPNNKITEINWTSYGNPPKSYKKPDCKISDKLIGTLNKTILTKCPSEKNTNAIQREIFLAEEYRITRNADELSLFGTVLSKKPAIKEKFLISYERQKPCKGNYNWSSVTSKQLGFPVQNELRYWYKFDYSDY